MPVFALVAEGDDSQLARNIQTKFKDNFYRIADRQWLVDANETVKSLCEELDVGEGGIRGVIAFKIDSFYGYHNKDLWDWLELPRSNGD